MGSVYTVERNRNGRKTQYRTIKYKIHGKWNSEILGRIEIIQKGEAREVLKQRERQIKLGQYGLLENGIPTLENFSEEYIKYQRDVKQKRSWQKDEAHLKRLNKIFGKKMLSDISSKDIDDYKQKRLNDVKPSSVNRELAVLRCLFNLAKKRKKFYGENPVSESGLLIENNEIERILTIEEENRLLESSADHLKPVITTALNTGMRKGEILSLKWTDVNIENKVITIRHTVSKSKKSRQIPINPQLKTTLLEQKLKTGNSEYVFLSPEGNPYLRPDSLKRCFEGARRRADIKGLRFHDLRHTAATRMIESGVNIVAVSKILGHASIKTTMRYVHPDASLTDAVESLSYYSEKSSAKVI